MKNRGNKKWKSIADSKKKHCTSVIDRWSNSYSNFWHLSFLLFFLFSFQNLTAQIPFVCQNNFYFSFGSGNGFSQLHEVIIADNGDVSFVPLPQSTGVSLNAVGYRSTDNFIYGISTTEDRLYRIDATGRGFPLNILDVNHSNGYYAATFTPDGEEMLIIEQGRNNSTALIILDFTDPNIPVKSRFPLTGPTIQTTDIAFDPLTGVLYGFDSSGERLVTINPTNGAVTANFPRTSVADKMGGLYFDAFGNMFGYGNEFNDNLARTFFGIDKETGAVEILGRGPNTSNKDGCACPFTVDLLKNVRPRALVPCTEIKYIFSISNISGVERTNVVLADTMPEDFVILRIDRNPYGGTVEGIGTNMLRISDMTLPLGQDSIEVIVEALPFAEGVYENQAYLENLPEGLGGTTPSDDPETLLADDPTAVFLSPLVVDLQNQQANLCEGSSLDLIAGNLQGIDYQWNTGSTASSITVSEAGLYAVTVTNGCETKIDSVTILEEPISVNLGPDITINLGDYVTLNPITNAVGQVDYDWSEKADRVNCADCEQLEIRPFFDTQYALEITSTSGCTANTLVNITVNKEQGIYIPNVFSPNLDGINDEFYIMGRGFAEVIIFQIYDRWGTLVFEQNGGAINDANMGWKGLVDRDQADSGVYSYYAKLRYLDEIEEQFFGDVTLVR
ncbi:MAG: gliding motility-associated C-terminal domain-containing protein [Bacteroidota bacterium]